MRAIAILARSMSDCTRDSEYDAPKMDAQKVESMATARGK